MSRRSVYAAIASLGLRPGRLGARTAGLGLASAFGVHLAGLALAPLAGAAGLDFASRSQLYHVRTLIADFSGQLQRTTHVAELLWMFGIIELVTLLLATFGSSWGARDEPAARSWRFALQRTWLLTPLLAVVGFVFAYLMERTVWGRWAGGASLDVFIGPVIFAGALVWILWAWLRCLAAPRPTEPPRRPPMCERCGYDLSGHGLEDRCPECAEPTLASLDEQNRPGPPWVQRRRLGRARAYVRTLLQATCRPRAFGRSLRAHETRSDHRAFFAGHLAASPLLQAAMAALLLACTEARFDGEEWLGLTLYTACVALVALVGLTLATASMIGHAVGRRYRRNLLTAAVQAACYLTPLALFGNVLVWLLLIFTLRVRYADWLDRLADSLGLEPPLLILAPWILVAVVFVAWYNTAIRRAVLACAYANR